MLYTDSCPTYPSGYLWDCVLPLVPSGRVFEIGCGNGALVRELRTRGHEVIGIDTSDSGVALGGDGCFVASAYDDLAARFGKFDCVISLEVIEHLFDPRRFVRVTRDLLKPEGIAIISTPFHGYWKNLALSVAGHWDAHLNPLWDGGHIKFWSERTLGALLAEQGFVTRFHRAGRFGPLAKSLIAEARLGDVDGVTHR